MNPTLAEGVVSEGAHDTEHGILFDQLQRHSGIIEVDITVPDGFDGGRRKGSRVDFKPEGQRSLWRSAC